MPTVLTRPDIKPVRGLHLRVGESVRGVAFPKCNVAVGMTVLGYYPLVPGQPEHDYCRGTVVGNPAGSDIIVDFPEQVRSLLLNPADPRGGLLAERPDVDRALVPRGDELCRQLPRRSGLHPAFLVLLRTRPARGDP